MNESAKKNCVYRRDKPGKRQFNLDCRTWINCSTGNGLPAYDERDHAFAEKFNPAITKQPMYEPLGDSGGGEGTMVSLVVRWLLPKCVIKLL